VGVRRVGVHWPAGAAPPAAYEAEMVLGLAVEEWAPALNCSRRSGTTPDRTLVDPCRRGTGAELAADFQGALSAGSHPGLDSDWSTL
jgi:hypothetical protein